jgi:2-(1,2-epoxy-1,2-dihydrophenyl)acetyl-CoA isomerase
MSNLVLVETLPQIGILTLDRPERHNSLVPELLNDLMDALDRLRRQPGLRALVLQANGRSFSTGGDVRGFFDHRQDAEEYANFVVGQLNEAILSLVALPVPVVAAVHGIVTGGSLGLVLACDIVLVAPEVTFTPFYTTVGYSPDGGWTAMLPDVIGRKRAAEILMLNLSINAEQAVAWGLANRIVPAERIRAEALAIAQAIAHQQPESVQRTRQLLWGQHQELAARLEEERQQFVRQIVTAEAQGGMAAFLQRNWSRNEKAPDRR